ncbi:MAG: hypothetical protein N2Z58_04255 [Fervidobacterium sp.]|nr:hypothetical protein [Fervidobacterium sp.]
MILVLFMVLRIVAIILLIYTFALIFRFFTSPESPTEVGRPRQIHKQKVPNIEDETLRKAFKVFGLTLDSDYSTASYRYYQIRRNVQNSPLPEQIKEARLKELDMLFDVLTEEYYRKLGKI